jgi:hypothetical protein
MSESENKSRNRGIIKFKPGHMEANMPLDTAYVRDNLHDNIDSLYYNGFQMRVNVNQNVATYVLIESIERKLIGRYGPFPVTIRKDGTMAALYVRAFPVIYAANSGGSMLPDPTITSPHYLYVVLRPVGGAEIISGDNPGCGIILVEAGNNFIWNEVHQDNSVIYLPRTQLSTMSGIKVRRDPFSNIETDANVVMCEISVYATIASPTAEYSQCYLYGFQAIENPYLGE